MTSRKILIIEDEHALGTALSFLVRRMGHLPTLAASAGAGLAAFEADSYAAVVLDIGLPDMSGLKVLEMIRQQSAALPVLVITAHATLDHAIHAQKSGATAYLTKPLDMGCFDQTLGSMLAPEMPLVPPQVVDLDSCAATLIGGAPCLREAFVGIARACAGDVPVLISGPSGSGKSLAASVIHAHGVRSSQLLETLACAQIQTMDELLSVGCGTLVLDEVTNLSNLLQAQVAHWLAEVGAADRPRLLATTSHDPRKAVVAGALREDLYYALSTLSIPLPPLRERNGDVPALAAFFIGMRGTGVASLTPPALAALQAYGWPGNVRELRHVIDYAVAMSGGGAVFLSHLPAHVAAAVGEGEGVAPGELDAAVHRWLDGQLAMPETERLGYDGMLDRVERVMLAHLLSRYEQRPTHMAAALRMHRATLRQKLRRVGLQRDEE